MEGDGGRSSSISAVEASSYAIPTGFVGFFLPQLRRAGLEVFAASS